MTRFPAKQEFVFPEGGEIQVNIIDMNGISVYKRVHQLDEQGTTRCDVNHLASGLFIAKVNAGTDSRIYEFVKY